MQVERFGEVDGAEVVQATLRSEAGATASVITWGAVLARPRGAKLAAGRSASCSG